MCTYGKNNQRARGDYDYANALYKTDFGGDGGHLPSINPDTGAVLKREGHPTYDKAVEGERVAGNVIGRVRGHNVSIPTKRQGFKR